MSGVGLTGAIVPLNGGAFTVFAGNIVSSLANLSLFAGCLTGTVVYVSDQAEFYTFDSANTFAVFSPLVVSGVGGQGRWFRRNKQYVVGNYTLWAQCYGYGAVGFTIGQQQATGSPTPDIILDMRSEIPGSSNQQGVTIDGAGNLWMAFNQFNTQNRIRKYPLASCLSSAVISPSVSLNLAGVTEAGYCLFDRQNGLWVPNGTHGTTGITSFSRYGQRAYSNNLGVGGISITFAPQGVTFPSSSNQAGSAFDGQGNLWTAVNFAANTTPISSNGGIFMMTPDQLVSSNSSLTPNKYWFGSNFTGSNLGATSNIAVAPTGLIWVSNLPDSKIQAWDPTQATGNPAPSIVITSAQFSGCYGLAFDSAGNLWINNANNNKLMRIPAANLGSSGVASFDVVLTPTGLPGSFGLESNIAFPNDPDRSGLLLAA